MSHQKRKAVKMPSKELRPYKEISKDLKPEDTAAVIDMICACYKNSGGRPCIYPNSLEGLEAFKENAKSYFSYLQSANDKLEERQQLIPDVEGLSLYCGIDRRTLERYRERGGEWERTIDYIKNSIAYAKKQLALKGKIPTVMAIFDLSNNHNYYNVSEYKLSMNNNDKSESDDNDISLEQRCAEMGLIWSEEQGEWINE